MFQVFSNIQAIARYLMSTRCSKCERTGPLGPLRAPGERVFRAWRRGPCPRSPLRLQQGQPCSLWGAPVLQMLLSVIASQLTSFRRMAKPREGDSPSCPVGGAGGGPAREPMRVGHETGWPTTASVTSLRQSPEARAMRHDQGTGGRLPCFLKNLSGGGCRPHTAPSLQVHGRQQSARQLTPHGGLRPLK